MTKELDVGAKAPTFKILDDEGNIVSSSDLLKNGPYVLYFYPKDNTPGCSVEAQDFAKNAAQFKKVGVQVIGVSPDGPISHQKFRAKFELPFTLLCDEERVLCEKFNVWVEKNNYGKKYMGVQRSTFLIGSDGKIAAMWPKVKVEGHVAEVLKAAKGL